MNSSLEYYNIEEIWEQEITPGQEETVRKINELLERMSIETLLDVGCGNGFLVNSLPHSIKATGLDISEEALKYVKVDKKVGSIDNIPFDDQSFDVVVCSDVLEHMTNDMFLRAIKEIERVAKKNIILVFPYREDLDYSRAKCVNCGCHFHINWHLRSMDMDIIQRNIKGFRVKKAMYAGEEWPASLGIMNEVEKAVDGNYSFWENAVCPHCNTRQVKKNRLSQEMQDEVEDLFKKLKGNTQLIDSIYRNQSMITKNELILVLERISSDGNENTLLNENSGLSICIEPQQDEHMTLENIMIVNNDKVIDMYDTTKVKDCITKYPKTPYIVKDSIWGEITEIDEKKVRKYNGQGNRGEHAIFVFPRNGKQIEHIVLQCKNISDYELIIQVYDTERSYIPIAKIAAGNEEWQEIVANIPQDIKVGEEGYIFDIISQEGISVECYIEKVHAGLVKDEIVVNPVKEQNSTIINLQPEFLLDQNLQLHFDIERFSGNVLLNIEDVEIKLDYMKYDNHIVCNLFSWMIKDNYILKKLNKQYNNDEIEVKETVENLKCLVKVKKEVELMDFKAAMENMQFARENIEVMKAQLEQIIVEKANQLQETTNQLQETTNQLQHADNQLQNALVNLEAKDIELNNLASKLNQSEIRVQNLEQESSIYREKYESTLKQLENLQKTNDNLHNEVWKLENRTLKDYILKRGK